ncbi:hypothetical protein CEXT_94111 [Caerostris extrusa]|uniref:Uncharacterized protein n=1 Tax=Caerostris extrusa TaxID=172846 RepID=A0AAV4WY56_CAEEX|nr:hypothetical protein CEXT_94111 [Caerostris extrusa]
MTYGPSHKKLEHWSVYEVTGPSVCEERVLIAFVPTASVCPVVQPSLILRTSVSSPPEISPSKSPPALSTGAPVPAIYFAPR